MKDKTNDLIIFVIIVCLLIVFGLIATVNNIVCNKDFLQIKGSEIYE